MRFQIGEEKSNAELIKHFEDITPKKYYDIPNIKIKGVNKGPFVHFFNNEKVIVLAGTFRKEDQPKLPSQIEVKRDGENEKYFESFKNTNKSIPIFEYTGTKTWKYIGDFRVKSSKYENDHFILFLQQDKSKEKSDTDQTPNPAQGAGFGHPETNKEVEEKAIKYVTKKYEKEGWVVESKEKDNLGYDLHCTKGLETRFVEVKGVKGNQQSFFITKNSFKRTIMLILLSLQML